MTGRMDRMKALLRTKAELCALSDLYADALANGRNDVSTLMNRDGWEIKKWWTAHGAQAHVHYQLVRERSALSSSAHTASGEQGSRNPDDGSAVRAGVRESASEATGDAWSTKSGRDTRSHAIAQGTNVGVTRQPSARTVQQLTLAEGV